jgi:pyridoxamine 5'-phosphate oxidase
MLDLIADIRKEYRLKSLSETDIATDPFAQFSVWWKEAIESKIDEVNAMTLATASADGLPSARIVLLKGFSTSGFSFFTNYRSYKGKHLEENPRACLVFFWKELERQVRVTGLVSKLAEEENNQYFSTRPFGSRLGAIASPQSEVIASRQWLEQRISELEGNTSDNNVERPSHWGGYIVKPVCIEFWQGRANRLHDRLQYTMDDRGKWIIERLAP